MSGDMSGDTSGEVCGESSDISGRNCIDKIKEMLWSSRRNVLENEWCLWYHGNHRCKEWLANLMQVATFAAIEDFWALINHIKSPSLLCAGSTYFFFKNNIKPMWEDPANSSGGRWTLTLDKSRTEIDILWLEVLICLIGEHFGSFSNIISGAVITSKPKTFRISLWLTTTDPSEGVLEVGRNLKKRWESLGLLYDEELIIFTSHMDDMSKSGSMIKVLYSV